MIHTTIHKLAKPIKWRTPGGATRTSRSWSSRASIFAITAGVDWVRYPSLPDFPSLIFLKLHSSRTWKYRDPSQIRASTEIRLTRNDASALAAVLLAAVNDYDQEKGKPS